MSLHLIDREGNKIEVKSGECPPQGCSVDIEWYKANGYVTAEEFFTQMRNKYSYKTP